MFENVKFFATVANDPAYLFGKLIRDNDVASLSRDNEPSQLIERLNTLLSDLSSSDHVAEAYGTLIALALENSETAVSDLDSIDFSNLRWGREIADMVKQHYQPSQRSVFASYASDADLKSSSANQRFEFKSGRLCKKRLSLSTPGDYDVQSEGTSACRGCDLRARYDLLHLPPLNTSVKCRFKNCPNALPSTGGKDNVLSLIKSKSGSLASS